MSRNENDGGRVVSEHATSEGGAGFLIQNQNEPQGGGQQCPLRRRFICPARRSPYRATSSRPTPWAAGSVMARVTKLVADVPLLTKRAQRFSGLALSGGLPRPVLEVKTVAVDVWGGFAIRRTRRIIEEG